MNPKDIADYLRDNPTFFDDHADVIAGMFVPHPHGGHAIPLAERQVLALREKNAELEMKLRELIQYGSENDVVSEKLHRSTLALFAAPDLETTLAVLHHSLHRGLRGAVGRCAPVGQGAGAVVPARARRGVGRERAATPTRSGTPYCGPEAAFETREWFDNADDLHVVRVPAAAHQRTRSACCRWQAPTPSAFIRAWERCT